MTTTRVFLASLDVHVDVCTDLLSCSACKSILPLNFITYQCKHRFCSSCAVDKCAECSATDRLPIDPVIFEALKTTTRVAPCGQEIHDAMTYFWHIKTCVKCLQHMVQSQHKIALTMKSQVLTMKRTISALEETNQRLKNVTSEQIRKYEALKEEMARKKLRRVIVTDDDHD